MKTDPRDKLSAFGMEFDFTAAGKPPASPFQDMSGNTWLKSPLPSAITKKSPLPFTVADKPPVPDTDPQKSVLIRMREVISEMTKEYAIAVEELTEHQLAEAILQAIACGDFQKHIDRSGMQGVTYLPYRRVQELEAKIKELTPP